MRLEVEVGAVGDALELLPADRELVLDVGAALRVVRELVRAVLAQAQVLGLDAEALVPGERVAFQYSNHASSSPGLTKNSISICSNSRVRNMKLPGVISLRNALPICAMPNGELQARRVHDVDEVDEDALRGLGAQVDDGAPCPRPGPCGS